MNICICFQNNFWNHITYANKLEISNSVIKHVHDFEEGRDNLGYEIDGMVIKVNDLKVALE